MAERTVHITRTTVVTHVAEPMGRERNNGPHLADLRAFVAACDGLPDDTRVHFEDGHLNEGGRRNVTIRASIRASIRTPLADPEGTQ